MNIDIEKLKVDREYWDSVAPGDAELFVPNSNFPWRRFRDDYDEFYEGGSWIIPIEQWTKKTWLENDLCCIPRPEPRQVEWSGEGLPPVGCECDVYHFEEWRKCEVVAYRDGMVIYWVPGFHEQETGISISHWFRPIRTKEQREREELVNMVCSQGFLSKEGNVSWEIADAIIAAGWRKEQ